MNFGLPFTQPERKAVLDVRARAESRLRRSIVPAVANHSFARRRVIEALNGASGLNSKTEQIFWLKTSKRQ